MSLKPSQILLAKIGNQPDWDQPEGVLVSFSFSYISPKHNRIS